MLWMPRRPRVQGCDERQRLIDEIPRGSTNVWFILIHQISSSMSNRTMHSLRVRGKFEVSFLGFEVEGRYLTYEMSFPLRLCASDDAIFAYQESNIQGEFIKVF